MHYALGLINQDRMANHLPALTLDGGLSRVALSHSVDMAARGYFSHFTPNGVSPYQRMQSAGIRYLVAGENLGTDTGTNRKLELVLTNSAMMKSPEHRANLLRPSFGHVGVGIAFVGQRLYITEDFSN